MSAPMEGHRSPVVRLDFGVGQHRTTAKAARCSDRRVRAYHNGGASSRRPIGTSTGVPVTPT